MPLPQLIRAVQPDMRVVVMLRDPVERMYSAFWYYGCLYNVYKDYGMTPKGFHKLVTVGSLWSAPGSRSSCQGAEVLGPDLNAISTV